MNTRARRKKMADINELKTLIQGVEQKLIDKIDAIVTKLDEKDKLIVELQNKVKCLEEKAVYDDKRYELLERKLDDGEQYSRRTSLRINGIKYTGKETSEESMQKVKEEVEKLGVNLSDSDYDRAHRVSRPVDKQGNIVKHRQMIVKFTSFHARTLVYKSRVKGGNRDGQGVSFYVD